MSDKASSPLAWLVGVGTGDRSLVSPRAADALSSAQLVIAPRALQSQSWVQLAAPATRLLWLEASEPDAAGHELVAAARAGLSVVRVRAGDGWRDELALRELRELEQAGVVFEVVPGLDPAAVSWRTWLDDRPLFGRRVVVTRMRDQASHTADLLRDRGAVVWVFPTIELHPPPDPQRLDQAAREVGHYDLVAFTSVNGVEQFFEALYRSGFDARALGPAKVAAIGSATASALRKRGIAADTTAKEFRGEELAAAILEMSRSTQARRVLLPRALEARDVLPAMLRDAGIEVDVVAAYQTGAPAAETLAPLVEAFSQRRVDAVLLTSSSTVRNLCDLLGAAHRELLTGTCLASIGPITTQTAQQLGLTVGVEAARYTLDGLVAALEKHYAR